MAIAVIKTGIRLAMMLDEVVVLQHTHQVGQKEDWEIDSIEWEVRPSEEAPQW